MLLKDATFVNNIHPSELLSVMVKLNTYDNNVIDDMKEFLSANGMSSILKNGCYLHVRDTAAMLQHFFGVTLKYYTHAEYGLFRHHEKEAVFPGELGKYVSGIFGLSNQFRAKTHHRVANAAASFNGYYSSDIAKLYDFPAGDGSGQTIALIELGGGFDLPSLQTYAQQLGIAMPKITVVGVDGATNVPDQDPNGADGEVMLDIEVVMGVASKAHIVVYFGTNTDQGFLDAIATAVNDTVNRPSVISISWGGPENSWGASSLTAFNEEFANAASKGITVLAAAGDDGATDGSQDNSLQVDFPGSSPFVVSCGGTQIFINNGAITNEVVWNNLPDGGAGGGGVSTVFATPTYQTKDKINKTHRCVPDISANASPDSGYNIIIDGQQAIVAGTSAVSPLYAGLIARLNQKLGKNIGYANPILYALNDRSFYDIVSGNNSYWQAGNLYDLASGLGRLNGTNLLEDVEWAISNA